MVSRASNPRPVPPLDGEEIIPVLQVWERVLALPIVGTLDTARALAMSEALLQEIERTAAEVVLLDVTAVPLVDTAVARHLLETVAAARLLGAEVLIVGLSSQLALTLVQFGDVLDGVTTLANLAQGLRWALRHLGWQVLRP